MKTLFKMALPVAAFVLASAGAVGTKAGETAKDDTAFIPVWIQNPNDSNCLSVADQNCSSAFTSTMCEVTHPTTGLPVRVYDKQATTLRCSIGLFRQP